MLSGVSSLFSETAEFPKGSLKEGAVGQITARLEQIVESLLESSQEINQTEIYLERLWSRFSRELGNQQNILQRKLICHQDIWLKQRGELNSLELPLFENYFKEAKQSALDVVEVLEIRTSLNPPLHPFKSRLESKLIKDIGRLKGFIDANQFLSLPVHPVAIRINKIIGKMVLFQADIDQEMIRFYFQSLELSLKICQIGKKITDRLTMMINQYQKGILNLALIEDGGDLSKCSARINWLIAMKNDWNEVFLGSIKALSAVPEAYGEIDRMGVKIRQKAVDLRSFLQIEVIRTLKELKIHHKIDKLQDAKFPAFVQSFVLRVGFFQKEFLFMCERKRKLLTDMNSTYKGLGAWVDNLSNKYCEILLEAALLQDKAKISKLFDILQTEFEVNREFFMSISSILIEHTRNRLSDVHAYNISSDVIEFSLEWLGEIFEVVLEAWSLNLDLEQDSQNASSSVDPEKTEIGGGASSSSSGISLELPD